MNEAMDQCTLFNKYSKHLTNIQKRCSYLFQTSLVDNASRGKMASSLGNMELMNNLTKIVQS